MTSCGHVTFSNVATIVSAINLVKSVLTHKASGLRFDAAVCKKDAFTAQPLGGAGRGVSRP